MPSASRMPVAPGRRIVITGASGNVGTALVTRLRTQFPDDRLVGVARRIPGTGDVYRDLEWHSIDLAGADAEARLRPVFDKADAVVHLAWGFQPTRNVEYLERVAVHGSRAVLDAASAAGVGQLVHMSSVGTYAAGMYGRRVDESWPTTGIRTSPYSRHKAAVEAMLDSYEADHDGRGVPIARMRPGFVVQGAAASELLRYGLPAWVPAGLIRLLPVLPLDRSFVIPLVHADDVAAAVEKVLQTGATGAFNLAAESAVGRGAVAAALGARAVHIPARVLAAIVDWSWRARLQPVDRGWLDLAFAVPLLDCGRAVRELGWAPTRSATDLLREIVAAAAERRHGDSEPLRKRSMPDLLRRDLAQRPITTRRLP